MICRIARKYIDAKRFDDRKRQEAFYKEKLPDFQY